MDHGLVPCRVAFYRRHIVMVIFLTDAKGLEIHSLSVS